MKFLIITPVRNEERFISITIESMQKQKLPPYRWLIVDDGSTDNTCQIIRSYMKKNQFIEYLPIKNRGYRKPGKGVIDTFYYGYNSIDAHDYDVIAKFDADLQFPPDTLQKIADAFLNNPRLGVTGGTRYERKNDDKPFRKVLVPYGFVGGPYKFYRKQCFLDIGGLIHRAGWDGVDTVRANMKGWQTHELPSVKIIHLKPTGTAKGEGLKKACEKYGDVSYYMGGYFWYFILRVIGRSIHGRNYKTGLYMLKGYFRSLSQRLPREPRSFRHYLKRDQISRLGHWIRILLPSFLNRSQDTNKLYN